MKNLRFRIATRWVLSGALLLLGGCGSSGPETVEVRGVVTLDGQPVEGAAVMFMPKGQGRPAEGVTNAQGEFSLTTFSAGDGALPGEHRVTVTLVELSGVTADSDGLSGHVDPGGVKEKWLVPKRYAVPDSSGLTVEVKPEMQPVKLDLTSE